jgi:hypothetical protein
MPQAPVFKPYLFKARPAADSNLLITHEWSHNHYNTVKYAKG